MGQLKKNYIHLCSGVRQGPCIQWIGQFKKFTSICLEVFDKGVASNECVSLKKFTSICIGVFYKGVLHPMNGSVKKIYIHLFSGVWQGCCIQWMGQFENYNGIQEEFFFFKKQMHKPKLQWWLQWT